MTDKQQAPDERERFEAWWNGLTGNEFGGSSEAMARGAWRAALATPPAAREAERDNGSGAGAERASESSRRHPVKGDPYTTGPSLLREAAERFAFWVYVPAEQRGEFVHELDEAIDDLTNCECEVTPLYATPPVEREALAAECKRLADIWVTCPIEKRDEWLAERDALFAAIDRLARKP